MDNRIPAAMKNIAQMDGVVSPGLVTLKRLGVDITAVHICGETLVSKMLARVNRPRPIALMERSASKHECPA